MKIQGVEIDWPSLIFCFDRPERQSDSAASIKMVIELILSCPLQSEQHAIDAVWYVWDQSMFHLRLIDAMISLPVETLSFAQLPGRRVITLKQFAVYPSSAQAYARSIVNSNWNSVDLIATLSKLVGSQSPEVKSTAIAILQKGKETPALLLLYFLRVPVCSFTLHFLPLKNLNLPSA